MLEALPASLGDGHMHSPEQWDESHEEGLYKGQQKLRGENGSAWGGQRRSQTDGHIRAKAGKETSRE